MTLILNDNIGATSAQCDSYVGTDGQLIHDKQAKTVRVMDGTTAGGTALAKVSDIIEHLVDVPDSASSAGKKGDYAVGSGYLYVCTATDTWKRVAISTWS